MPRLAANLSMMFNEVPFLERFTAARKAGFEGVEFLFPYEYPAAELRSRMVGEGLTQVLFNMPPGDWANGERGLAALPGRHPQREALLSSTAELYAISRATLYRLLRGERRPRDAHRADRGTPRVSRRPRSSAGARSSPR